MTPEPIPSSPAARRWLSFAPFVLVLLASAIGIAGWITAPKERPRLELAIIADQPADPEKEAAILHRVIREFPGALAEAAEWYLKQSQDAHGTEFTIRFYKTSAELDAIFRTKEASKASALDASRVIGERAFELLTARLHADAGALDRSSRTFAMSLIRRFEHDVFGLSYRAITNPSTTVPIVSIILLSLKYPVSTSSAMNPFTLVQEVERNTSMFIGGPWETYERGNFAEDFALLNAKEALNSVPSDRRGAAASYEAAATLATLRAENLFPGVAPARRIASNLALNRAIAHLVLAESLTDWQRHPADWARIENKLSSYLAELGHSREAEEILREVVAENEQRLGLDHPVAAASREQLAAALENKSVHASDLPGSDGTMFLSAQVTIEAISCVSSGTSSALHTKVNRANPPFPRSRDANAEGLFHSAISESSVQLSQDIREILQVRSRLADVLDGEGKHAEAEPHYSQVREQYTALLGPKHNDTLRATRSLARCLHAQGKDAEAMKFARLAAEGWRETLGADHPRTVLARDLIRSIPTPPQ